MRFLRGAFAARHGEVLRGDRIAVLEPGETRPRRVCTPAARASSRATHSVLAPRLRTRSRACGPSPLAAKPRISSTSKSSGECAQHARAERLTPGGRRRQRRAAPVIRDHAEGSGIVSNNTTACAARPSLRPMKPRCSVVVALMFTWFSVTPSICASERRISSR